MIRNRDAICQALLSTGEFLVNDCFEQYLDLVCQEDQPRTRKGCQKHHILQRFYFKMVDQPVNSKKENLINLLYRDHCLAHWLLYNCTEGALRRANAYAFLTLTTREKLVSLSEQEYEEIQKRRESISINPSVDKDVLESFLTNHSHSEAAREFGVDINTITQYKRKYGLPVKGRNMVDDIGEEEFKAYALTHNNIETAKHFHMCTQTVGILKNALGLPIRQTTDTSTVDPQEFMDYLKTHTNTEAAAYFHICLNSVTKLEKRLGLQLRSGRSKQEQISSVDLKAFQEYTCNHSIRETVEHFQINEGVVAILRKQLGVTNVKYQKVSQMRKEGR